MPEPRFTIVDQGTSIAWPHDAFSGAAVPSEYQFAAHRPGERKPFAFGWTRDEAVKNALAKIEEEKQDA